MKKIPFKSPKDVRKVIDADKRIPVGRTGRTRKGELRLLLAIQRRALTDEARAEVKQRLENFFSTDKTLETRESKDWEAESTKTHQRLEREWTDWWIANEQKLLKAQRNLKMRKAFGILSEGERLVKTGKMRIQMAMRWLAFYDSGIRAKLTQAKDRDILDAALVNAVVCAERANNLALADKILRDHPKRVNTPVAIWTYQSFPNWSSVYKKNPLAAKKRLEIISERGLIRRDFAFLSERWIELGRVFHGRHNQAEANACLQKAFELAIKTSEAPRVQTIRDHAKQMKLLL